MTLEEFKAFKRAIAKDGVKLNRGEMSQQEYYSGLVVTLGKDTFKEVIEIMDGEIPR
jgi:hypothetical protein